MPNIDLKHPLGEFVMPETLTGSERDTALQTLRTFPENLSSTLSALAPHHYELPYRPGGWTVRTLIHHLADSHMVAYSWMRLALTESWPTVYSYDPDRIAALSDSALPESLSLQILTALHTRWVATLEALPPETWKSTGYIHPETGGCSLEQALAMYDWHCRHHLAHITQFLQTKGLEHSS